MTDKLDDQDGEKKRAWLAGSDELAMRYDDGDDDQMAGQPEDLRGQATRTGSKLCADVWRVR
jgi:hypothetical protein